MPSVLISLPRSLSVPPNVAAEALPSLWAEAVADQNLARESGPNPRDIMCGPEFLEIFLHKWIVLA